MNRTPLPDLGLPGLVTLFILCVVPTASGFVPQYPETPEAILGAFLASGLEDVIALVGDVDSGAGLSSDGDVSDSIPNSGIVILGRENWAGSFVSSLFPGGLSVSQVNLLFCGDRVGAIQLLFDDSVGHGDTVQVLRRHLALGPPVPPAILEPSFHYPLRGFDDEARQWPPGDDPRLRVTAWDLGEREAVYQPVNASGPGAPINGQFWMTDRAVAFRCATADAGER